MVVEEEGYSSYLHNGSRVVCHVICCKTPVQEGLSELGYKAKRAILKVTISQL